MAASLAANLAQVSSAGIVPPADGHRWVELIDESGERWMFDATFLLSGYHCIYGQGCPSIEPEPDLTESLGCCVHGAHFTDDDDMNDVAAAAAQLDESNWQHIGRAEKKGSPFKKNKEGAWVTRKVDGACIFLNRRGFEGGPGCALHRLALEQDKRPVDYKPDVCWQVPIRFDVHTDDYAQDTVFVRAWERRDWGPGGDDFHWWCIEEPAAYTNKLPVYQTSKDELILLVGEALYKRLVVQLEQVQIELDMRNVPVSFG